jgi:hypothetical protein
MSPRTTRTYAVMNVSRETHEEIMGKLKDAGYEHAIQGNVLDMHGIALAPPEPRHCDEYIEDPDAPEALRTFLKYARSPAHGHLLPGPKPELYATWQGKRVKVVMASRMGDIGFTFNHALTGYDKRDAVENLTDYSDKP